MKTVVIKCDECGKSVNKLQKEIRRKIKIGKTRFFCGLSCWGKFTNKEHPRKGNVKHFGTKRVPSTTDELSPFRWLLRRIVTRCKERNREIHLTLEDIKCQWDSQQAICPYSKVLMELPRKMNGRNESPLTASIDRINSSRGYTKDNIEFVTVAVNYAKNTFSQERMMDFFDNVRNSATIV